MAQDKDHYNGLWRGSAKEAVPYNDDYPDALLVLPELWDGAVGQGEATQVTTTFHFQSNGQIHASVEDTGGGIKNERRLKSWAAPKSMDNLHRNGHGSKKCLTKFMPDYETADWMLEWRGKRNPNLQRMKGPFLGSDTQVEEDEDDHKTLMPHGTRWSWKFYPNVLELNVVGSDSTKRSFKTPQNLMNALREIITTRYSEAILQRVEFVIKVIPSKGAAITKSSQKDGWHSFQWHLNEAVKSGIVKKIMSHEEPIDGGSWTFDYYYINKKGNESYSLKNADKFPFYAQKNMRASRIHTFLEGRMIEAIPIHRVFGREAPHNDHNGYIGFVNFKPTTKEDFEKMPQPATTKVSFWSSDPKFRTFMETLALRIVEDKKRKDIAAAEEDAQRQRLEQEAIRRRREEADALAKKRAEEAAAATAKKQTEAAVKKIKVMPLVKDPEPVPTPAPIQTEKKPSAPVTVVEQLLQNLTPTVSEQLTTPETVTISQTNINPPINTIEQVNVVLPTTELKPHFGVRCCDTDCTIVIGDFESKIPNSESVNALVDWLLVFYNSHGSEKSKALVEHICPFLTKILA